MKKNLRIRENLKRSQGARQRGIVGQSELSKTRPMAKVDYQRRLMKEQEI